MPKKSGDLFLPVLSLDRNSLTPIHRQIYESFSHAIVSRRLRPGTKMPSTRELAGQLDVSRNTVMTAFEQLLADGFLQGRIGSGTYVTDQVTQRVPVRQESLPQTDAPGPPGISRLAAELAQHRKTFTQHGWGAFRVSTPAVNLFPWTTWCRLVADCTRRQTREHLSYSCPTGLKTFRDAIATYLRASRNVRCEADQVIVVSGSQQALCLTAQSLLNRGEEVWIEDPCYNGAREAFRLSGMTLAPVAVDNEGFPVELAKQMFPNARLAYVTPSHQYPLGVTMSLNRRLDLLDWAAAGDRWVIEDDYDSEYRFISRPLSSLQGLSEKNRVVYVGTFSKVLFPAIRIGYLVVPPDLVDAFAAVRAASDIFPPTLSQLVLTEFLSQGHLARHLRRMRGIYEERLECLKEAVRAKMSGLASIEVADSGLHVVVFPAENTDDATLSRAASEHGVIAIPLSPCYSGSPTRSGLILGYGSADPGQIEKGVENLARAFEALRAGQTTGP